MTDKSEQRCRYWLAGKCKFETGGLKYRNVGCDPPEDVCWYKHPEEGEEDEWEESVSKIPSRKCRHYIRKGYCDFGSRCGFRHPVDRRELQEWRDAENPPKPSRAMENTNWRAVDKPIWNLENSSGD